MISVMLLLDRVKARPWLVDLELQPGCPRLARFIHPQALSGRPEPHHYAVQQKTSDVRRSLAGDCRSQHSAAVRCAGARHLAARLLLQQPLILRAKGKNGARTC